MNLLDLFSLQGTLFALMIVGAILKKKEIIDANGKKCLTDLCINVVIPCNIFNQSGVIWHGERSRAGRSFSVRRRDRNFCSFEKRHTACDRERKARWLCRFW